MKNTLQTNQALAQEIQSLLKELESFNARLEPTHQAAQALLQSRPWFQ